MKTKHKILEELYQVQLVNKEPNVTLVDVSLDIDILRKRINIKEQDFHSSLEALNANKDIYVAWNENMATITQKGILSLNNKTYLKDHQIEKKERIDFYIRIGGFIIAVLTLILAFRICS